MDGATIGWLIFAVALAVWAVRLVMQANKRSQRSRAIAAASHVDLATAASGGGGLVRFSGQLVPGPQGELAANMTGSRCVWWAHKRTKQQMRQPYRGRGGHGTRTVVISQGSSDQPFGITDGTTGVWVNPRSAEVHGAEKTLEHREYDTFTTEEWVLRPGEAANAVGVVRTDANGAPWLEAGDDDALVTLADLDDTAGRERRGALLRRVGAGFAALGAVALTVIAFVQPW